MKKLTVVVEALLALSLILSGCVGVRQPVPLPATVPAETSPAGSTAAPASAAATWQTDGVISQGEYAHDATIGSVHLWWRNDAQSLYLAFEAKTTGWVAVGLDPESRMKGANIIIGSVANGQAKVVDAYGTAETGAHPADVDLGGKNDILAFAGKQEAGTTRFEVQIPLNSGDKYDKALQPGKTYKVIAALSDSADNNAYHSSRNTGEITLDVAQ
jgi:hypothetical protein